MAVTRVTGTDLVKDFVAVQNEMADHIDAIESAPPDSYLHEQGVPSTTWSVTHNLNGTPSVDVVDSAGTAWYGSVVYTSLNTLTITFGAPFSGVAHIRL